MFRRNLTPRLLEALADTPAVLVNGARQTGKSTLVQDAAGAGQRRQYLTFDDPGLLAVAKADPNGFVAGLHQPVTLDEVQHAPEIFPVLKIAIDRNRQPGQFLLTGSANVFLLPKLSESLAGRIEILTLWPLSQGEVTGRRDGLIDDLFASKLRVSPSRLGTQRREDLLRTVLIGGYPPAIARTSVARREAWFRSYVMTILQRDIRDLSNLADLAAVPRLLSVVASRAGSLLNFADVSRTAALPQTTLKRYFALLEATYLVQQLRPWARNLGKRVIQTPKVYLNDTGLLAFLLGVTAERLKTETNLAGTFFENFVVMELFKQAAWSETQPEIFYWRTASGQEVDIVLEDRAGRVAGIEVKASATLGRNDVSGLDALAKTVGKNWVRGVVLYAGASVIPFSENLHGIPIARLWEGQEQH
jgi:uncharacterized protein